MEWELRPGPGVRFFGKVWQSDGEIRAACWASAPDADAELPVVEVFGSMDAARMWLDTMATTRGFDPVQTEVEWPAAEAGPTPVD